MLTLYYCLQPGLEISLEYSVDLTVCIHSLHIMSKEENIIVVQNPSPHRSFSRVSGGLKVGIAYILYTTQTGP